MVISKVTQTLTAGILLCRQVRDCLKIAEAMGFDIKWVESSGWIERTFTVIGEPRDVRRVMETIAIVLKKDEKRT